MGEITDGDLVRRTLAGEREAIEVLVRRYSGRVLGICHAKVGSADAAEDLAQETLLRAFRALATLRDPEKWGAWLGGIARRVCLDYLKTRPRAPVLLGSSEIGGDHPGLRLPRDRGPDTATESRIQDLMAEVEDLPEDQREVLTLYYTNDLTYQQLGEVLGVSAATVNARLTKARARLRARLDGRSPPDSGGADEV